MFKKLLDQIPPFGAESSTYLLGLIISKALNFFTFLYITKILAPSEFGQVALVQSILSIISVIIGLNIGSGISFYFYQVGSPVDKKNLVSLGFVLTLFLSLFFCIFIFSSNELLVKKINKDLSDQGNYILTTSLKIGSLSALLNSLQLYFQLIFRLENASKKYIITDFIQNASTAFSIFFLLGKLDKNSVLIFYGGLIGSIFGFLYAAFFIKIKDLKTFSFSYLNPVLKYCLPQYPGLVFNLIQLQSGIAILNHFSSFEEQGYYAFAFSIGNILTLFVGAFRLAYDPYAFSIMNKNNAYEQYAKAFSFYNIVYGLLLIWFPILIYPLLFLLVNKNYSPSFQLICFFAASVFLSGATNILSTGIWISKKTFYTSYVSFLTCVFFGFCAVLLTKQFQAKGAAIAYFLGSLVLNILMFVFSKKLFKVKYKVIQMWIFVILFLSASFLSYHFILNSNFRVAFQILFGIFLSIFLLKILNFKSELKNKNELITV